ncbi:MAG TPA: ribosome recycling factor [Rickettsiales bacterium]|nr:ribosome recycling factor [Rickettsiales bacterium]
MINQLTNKTRTKMEETMASLRRDLGSISTGRATPNLVDTVRADVYGSLMPLAQVATISVSDSSTLVIQVWDKGNVKAVEKGIVNSNLGFNPMIDGQLIRISIPKLSEERRKELAKLAKKYGEDKKIALRNVRRDILDEFKKHEKELGKDAAHGFNDVVQKITDEFVTKIDNEVLAKEKEIMKV